MSLLYLLSKAFRSSTLIQYYFSSFSFLSTLYHCDGREGSLVLQSQNVFFIIFMESYAIFNVTLINSEGTCQDYFGCLNATPIVAPIYNDMLL